MTNSLKNRKVRFDPIPLFGGDRCVVAFAQLCNFPVEPFPHQCVVHSTLLPVCEKKYFLQITGSINADGKLAGFTDTLGLGVESFEGFRLDVQRGVSENFGLMHQIAIAQRERNEPPASYQLLAHYASGHGVRTT
jgi:hypothetical protein